LSKLLGLSRRLMRSLLLKQPQTELVASLFKHCLCRYCFNNIHSQALALLCPDPIVLKVTCLQTSIRVKLHFEPVTNY
jgi:hypothetical protein